MNLVCAKCGAALKTPQRNKSGLCRKCQNSSRKPHQCPLCGRLTKANGEHECQSVELKGERHCVQCGKLLSNEGWARWSKWCGRCSKKRHYQFEKDTRQRLKEKFGGKCGKCGYDKCQAALHFHHVDASEKYQYRKSGASSIKEIKRHPERFLLLCANCHIELHQKEHDDAAETKTRVSLSG